MITRDLLLLAFLFLFTSSVAQPDKAGIDNYISEARADWDVPGMSVGIIHDGKVFLSEGYGVLEVGGNEEVTGNTLFAIASNTKAFISAAIGILVEEGKLDWDDPVVKHLPYFALYDSYVSQNTTVRDLLCHRVGLGTFSGDVIWYKSNYTAEEGVKRAKYVPQAFPFRSGYGYSNLMFITAGEVIKAVSGKSWAAFVQEKILDPLEMDRTQTSVVPLKGMENVATPHKPVDGKSIPIAYVNWDNMGAAGGILSSSSDMLQWIQLQINHGKFKDDQIFKRKTQLQWWTPHNNFTVSDQSREIYANRNFSGYGLGWSISDYAGELLVSHGGGYDGMYSRVVLLPEKKLGIVVLTNSMKGITTPLTYYIIDRFLERPEKDWSGDFLERTMRRAQLTNAKMEEQKNSRIEGTSPSLEQEKYTGTYHDDMFGDIVIKKEGNQLRLTFPMAPKLNADLNHWHYDTFQIDWDETHAWFDFGTLQFLMDNYNTKPLELQFDVPNNDIFFYEIEAKKVKE